MSEKLDLDVTLATALRKNDLKFLRKKLETILREIAKQETAAAEIAAEIAALEKQDKTP